MYIVKNINIILPLPKEYRYNIATSQKNMIKIYSLWSKIVATLRSVLIIFLGEFQKCKKSTQALSVYRKGTFCIYNECLIVALAKVTIKRKGEKGHSLSYQFKHYMEYGDASNEEAPPLPPKNKDLSKNMRMQIVAMLQGMEIDGSLRQGLVTTIAKRFSVPCCTVHHLWKLVVNTCATGIINSPEFNSWGKILGGCLFI